MPVSVMRSQNPYNGVKCSVQEDIEYTFGIAINDQTPGHSKSALWVNGANVTGYAGAWSAWYAADAAASGSVAAYSKHTFGTKVPANCVLDTCTVTYHRFATGQVDGSLSSNKCNGDASAAVNCAGKAETIELTLLPQLDANQGTTTTTTTGTVSGSGTISAGPGVSVSGNGSIQVVKTTKETTGGGDSQPLATISDDMTASCTATVVATTTVSLHANAYDGGLKHVSRMQVDITNKIENVQVSLKCACEEEEHGMAPKRPPDGEFAAAIAEQRRLINAVVAELEKSVNDLTAYPASSSISPADKIQSTLTVRLSELADTVVTPDHLENFRALQTKIQGASSEAHNEVETMVQEMAQELAGHAHLCRQLLALSDKGYRHNAGDLNAFLTDVRRLHVAAIESVATLKRTPPSRPGEGNGRPRRPRTRR